MKLQDALPDRVTVNGHVYRLKLDFRNVLRLLDVMGREGMVPGAREWQALRCVMRRPPRECGPVLAAVMGLLFPSNKAKKENGPKLTDFEQDADMIRAAFWQEYRINLFRDRLHWMEFSVLLSGLPEGSRYSEVLGIRARPMPAPTKWNAEERKWLAKAKAEYALRLSGNEAAQSLSAGLRSVAESLLALAQTRGDDHG